MVHCRRTRRGVGQEAVPRACVASQAVEKLWEAILATSRVDDDPVAAWEAHNEDLHDRCAVSQQPAHPPAEVHERQRHGPDRGHDSGGGSSAAAARPACQGIFFNPNIPTEECFTSPMKGQAEGIVYSTKPLSYQGQLIDELLDPLPRGQGRGVDTPRSTTTC